MNEDVTRRGLLRTTGALGVGLFAARAGLSAETAQPSGDWSQFGFDAANTHFNQYSSGPEGSVGVRWTYDGGDGVARSPAIVDGTVYASPGGQVVALDADSGERLWTYDDGAFFVPPAVSNGRVFVGTTDGRILALSAENGDIDWERETPSAVVAPGTVADGVLYMGDSENLYALDPASGDQQWQLGASTGSAPAVGADSVWTASGQTVTVVLQNTSADDARQTAWPDNARTVGVISDSSAGLQLDFLELNEHGPPVIGSGQAYFGADGLRSMNIEQGERTWHTATDIGISTAPALDGESLYIGGTDSLDGISSELAANAGTVYSLAAADGSTNWTFEAAGSVDASPVATNSVLYVSTGAGVVHALNIFTGNEVWRQEVGGELGVPVVTGDRMYVGSSEQGLVAIEERDPTPTPEPTATPTPEPTPEPTATPTPEDSDSETDTDTSGSGDETATPEPTESADGGGPGFGIAGGLAGLGGLAYLLRRQDDE